MEEKKSLNKFFKKNTYEDIFQINENGVFLDYYRIGKNFSKNPLKAGIFLDEKNISYVIMEKDRILLRNKLANPMLEFGESISHIASFACKNKKVLVNIKNEFCCKLKEYLLKDLVNLNKEKEDILLISLYTNSIFAHILSGYSPENLISFPYERSLKGVYKEDFSKSFKDFGEGLFLINPQISRLIGSKFVMEAFELNLKEKNKTLLLNAGERGEIAFSYEGSIYSSEFSIVDIMEKINFLDKENALMGISDLLEGYIKLLIEKASSESEISKIYVIEDKLPKIFIDYINEKMNMDLKEKIVYINEKILDGIVKHLSSRENFSNLNSNGLEYLMIDTKREEKDLINNFIEKYNK